MKKLIVSAFIASSLITGPGMLVTSSGAFAQRTCDSSAPAEWFRPGGFCDAIGAGRSLTGPVDAGCTEYVPYYGNPNLLIVGAREMQMGERVHVAATCTVDCTAEASGTVEKLEIGDRLRVAQYDVCGSTSSD